MSPRISVIDSDKPVSDTLADLRRIFKAWNIEEWEPVPGDDGRSYSVRYFRNKQWTEIKSQLQPNKAMNARVCLQVIQYLKLWENRGVTGIAKGITFMGELVATQTQDREDFEQSCAILGVEPEASVEEIKSVYRTKIQFAHPDKGGDPERFKRIQKAYDYIIKIKGDK